MLAFLFSICNILLLYHEQLWIFWFWATVTVSSFASMHSTFFHCWKVAVFLYLAAKGRRKALWRSWLDFVSCTGSCISTYSMYPWMIENREDFILHISKSEWSHSSKSVSTRFPETQSSSWYLQKGRESCRVRRSECCLLTGTSRWQTVQRCITRV